VITLTLWLRQSQYQTWDDACAAAMIPRQHHNQEGQRRGELFPPVRGSVEALSFRLARGPQSLAPHRPRTADSEAKWIANEHRRRRGHKGKKSWPLAGFVGPSWHMARGLQSR
jgi:hypothetical protein